MRAAQINQYGEQDVLRTVTDAPKPTINSDEILVEVHAASVNPFDWKVMAGQVQSMAQLTFPATLGGDVAGVVAEIGEDVTGFSVGQEVYGQANALSGQGSFAEFTSVKPGSVAPKPAGIDFVTAAALPLTAVSAYQALIDTMHLQEGQRVLIHGGAGGIGTLALQIAKKAGAYVVTTAGPEDLDYVRELGADEVVDYTSQQFEDVAHDMDAVYDTIGGETQTRSFSTLKKGGVIVSMVQQPDEALAQQHEVRASMQFTQLTPERLQAVSKLVESGALTVTVDKVFPLEQAAEALDYLHTGHHRGKVVIRVKE